MVLRADSADVAMGNGPSGPHTTVWVLLRLPAQGHVIQNSCTTKKSHCTQSFARTTTASGGKHPHALHMSLAV